MNSGPMKRWLPKLDAKSGPLESGDFGDNGENNDFLEIGENG